MNAVPLILYFVSMVAYLVHFARRQPAVGRTATTLLVAAILIDSIRVWTGILFGGAERTSTETPFIASALTEEV